MYIVYIYQLQLPYARQLFSQIHFFFLFIREYIVFSNIERVLYFSADIRYCDKLDNNNEILLNDILQLFWDFLAWSAWRVVVID